MPVRKSCQLCEKVYFVKPSRNQKTKYCSIKCLNTTLARKSAKIRKEKYNSKEYLLSKIKIDKKTGCWIWQASKNEGGYGRKRYKGRQTYVHRIFYEVFVGEIPKEMFVLHRCDTPSCVRPSCLFIGTHQNNSDDKYKKKRNNNLKGEEHGMSKLTEKDVLEIRRLYKKGWPSRKIGRKFNMYHTSILCIVKRKTWNHID